MDADAAVIAVVVGACVAAAAACLDQRALREASAVVATFPTTTFEEAMAASNTSWFRKKLRCDKLSFLFIYQLVFDACESKPALNSKHSLIKRLALTMLYLAQGGTEDAAATVLDSLSKRFVRMPRQDEPEQVEAAFYSVAGFPGVIGAIDGTLIEIPRPSDYEGWYSRKNFPALNVQAVVDASCSIISYCWLMTRSK